MTERNWTPLLLAITFSMGIYLGVKIGQRAPHILGDTSSSSSHIQNKLDEVMRYINARYLDKVNQDELLGGTIDNLLQKLDPHSSYISAEEITLVNDQMDGDFEGIGVEYIVTEDTMNVVSALPGGPSEQAGIMSGDKIVAIEDSSIAGVKITTDRLIKKLRGAKGTQVHLAVKRGTQLLNMTVTRDEIPNRSVDAGFMLDEKTGYIKVNRFAEKTYKEFMEKLDFLVEKNKMQDLVIDLRGNPGGYVQKSVDILNQFFKEKEKMLVYMEGLNSPKQEYKTSGQAFYNIGKIAVLVDESSASASEIVAGALQDWDRATVIGRRTYGKGLVQEQYPLSDGSALRLTVAQYYIPSGRCIQKPYKNNKDYDNDVENRLKNGELVDFEKNKGKDTSKFYTASGRLVRGGGGITPDIFVPIESFQADEDFAKLRNQVSQFTIDYVKNNKSSFSTDENTFLNGALDEKIFAAFIQYAEKHNAKTDRNKISIYKDSFSTLLKARIGRILFSDETQYKAFARNDRMIEKALESLK